MFDKILIINKEMVSCKKCGSSFTPSIGLVNFCSLQCRNSRIFSDQTKQKKRQSNLNKQPWNKGKKLSWTKSTCLYCGKDINHTKSKPKKYHSECWLKSAGGYRRGSGIGKSGWYKGYWCDSSYELVWLIYNLEHGCIPTRNKKTYTYTWENKKRKYTPDFITQSGELIEIKGYINDQTRVKLKLVPNLKILMRSDLNTEFNYVITKYGVNFLELYENNPYKLLVNTCKVCGSSCKQKNKYCSRACSGTGNNKNSKIKKYGLLYE